ncbi:MAG: fumarylacetoacetate hydrolase family protein [Pseudoxanthomonas suwonensis]|nr:fumarylacetoacetate hydrolase family protein [Pseudoxanthomonas suwonensis]
MAGDVIAPPPRPYLPMADGSGSFPVRRIHCVGRNFADHAREMGAEVPAAADRGRPVFFSKPADAIWLEPSVSYPRGTDDLHHEVELVVALGKDAPPRPIDREQATALVFGYGLGLDLTRRDLQAAAKAKGLPWDTAKGFDASAPMTPLLRAHAVPPLQTLELSLKVNGSQRQHGRLQDMVWDVADILVELSRLYALRAGDVVMMGTPAGVGALQPGDNLHARLGVPGHAPLLQWTGVVSPPDSR